MVTQEHDTQPPKGLEEEDSARVPECHHEGVRTCSGAECHLPGGGVAASITAGVSTRGYHRVFFKPSVLTVVQIL